MCTEISQPGGWGGGGPGGGEEINDRAEFTMNSEGHPVS